MVDGRDVQDPRAQTATEQADDAVGGDDLLGGLD